MEKAKPDTGKRILLFFIAIIAILLVLGLSVSLNSQNLNARLDNTEIQTGVDQVDSTKATVYFTSDVSTAGLEKLMQHYMARLHGKVGVKVHFGDEGNEYYIKPAIYKDMILQLKGTFIESNVLYKGKRRVTETHIALAKEHGFGYAPIDIVDSEGEAVIPYHGKHFDKVFVGSHLGNYNSFLIISHFKGHGNAGFGGAIKNVGMGLAAIPGKMAIHADSNPLVTPQRCIKCGKCTFQCPVNAITLDPLHVDLTKCIACGKCVGVCPSGALRIPWGKTGENGFLERLTDYANAIMQGRDAVYINFLTDISPDCDCMGDPRKPFVKDIGILISDDMVAIDAASCDLVDKAYGKHDAFLHIEQISGRYALDYGQQIGLGHQNYELVTE